MPRAKRATAERPKHPKSPVKLRGSLHACASRWPAESAVRARMADGAYHGLMARGLGELGDRVCAHAANSSKSSKASGDVLHEGFGRRALG